MGWIENVKTFNKLKGRKSLNGILRKNELREHSIPEGRQHLAGDTILIFKIAICHIMRVLI
jgi:hypothetical protein